MANNVAPPSLQRTNSSGHLHIYILIEDKIDQHLLIISRDQMPPALRSGKLTINQKVTFRDGKRQRIEGVIVYMSMLTTFLSLNFSFKRFKFFFF